MLQIFVAVCMLIVGGTYARNVEKRFLDAVTSACQGVETSSANADPADCVLRAADKFCWKNWMMLVGDEKGPIVDDALRARVAAVRQTGDDDAANFTALELGTYVGYSAVRLARLLPAGGKLYTVDPDPDPAAKKVISLAGLLQRVTLLRSTDTVAIRKLQKQGVKLDFVFIDHEKEMYISALRQLESAGMLRDGAVVVADNVVYFRIRDYLKHVRKSGLYVSKLFETALEYTKRNSKGVPEQRDGVEVSTFTPIATRQTEL